MVHQREGERLDAWLEKIMESGLPELQSFASGVERDKAAVKAGLTWSINNGMVEGHVTKLKRDLAANVRKGRICSASPAYPPCIVVRSRLLVRCGELRN